MQIKKREMLLGANLTQRLSCYFCFVLHKSLQLSLAVAILHSTSIRVFFSFFSFFLHSLATFGSRSTLLIVTHWPFGVYIADILDRGVFLALG